MAFRALPAWLWTTLLLFLCLLPRQFTPERRTAPLAASVPHADKAVHLAIFAGFGLLWTRAVAPTRRSGTILLIGVLFAVGTELAQGLVVVDRDPDLLDALADVAGLAAGVASYRLVPWLSAA